jgi:hypothetical protein
LLFIRYLVPVLKIHSTSPVIGFNANALHTDDPGSENSTYSHCTPSIEQANS